IPGVCERTITDVRSGGHRLVELFQDSNGSVLECNVLGSKDIIETVLNVIPDNMVLKVTQDEIQKFLDLCDGRDETITHGPLKSIFDFVATTLHSLLMIPGTKWCGPGDIARNYDDLGKDEATDMCCRDHDHSSDYMAPFETKNGVTNLMPYTM
ncbi:unnamed protein product, partial [Ixodes hexagonus]